jgi:hypothetical protein
MLREKLNVSQWNIKMEERMKEAQVKEEKRSRKRTLKAPPTFALPVRTLWELASEEQRVRAQAAGIAILEHWTGRINKGEVAKRLNIPPLRVWQLSQQATSGMLAGLLVQPKTRAKGVPMSPNEDPKALLKKIKELEENLRRQDLLIAVLRSMPGCRDAKIPMEEDQEETRARKTEIPKGSRSEGRKAAPQGEKK